MSRREGGNYSCSLYVTAIFQKLTPPEFTSIASRVHPRYSAMKPGATLRSFSPTYNFTVGYAQVERIRAAIILNTCFRRYFSLSLCASILRWWTANEQRGGCILTEIVWGFLGGPVPAAILLCWSPTWGWGGGGGSARLMVGKWATSPSASGKLRGYKTALPATRWLLDRQCWVAMQTDELWWILMSLEKNITEVLIR